jgi:hypothetical protein
MWHGVRVSRQIIEQPQTITVSQVLAEKNQEVRRIMLTRMGEEKFLHEGGATKLQSDDYGSLYRLGDEETLAVRVENSTIERDGSRKPYWLYVHPELRPMRRSGTQVALGDPQSLTARNAVASTFGLRGEDYAPAHES